jgi:predicted amidohydrolase YtcJ
MAEQNILIAQQPNFTYTLEGRYAANLVGERLQTNNPLRTPLSHGIFVALGADIMPTDPLLGIYSAVTRRGMSGATYGLNERISVPEAVTGYTRNGAYLTFEEHLKGTLEPGKLADFVVLSDDLLTIDPDRILEVRVDVTVLGGRIVYDRAAPTGGR